MSSSKIQKTLAAEALQATMQERRSKHAAWLQREARRKNGGLAHAVRLEIRSENKHAVKSAEENGEWVSMTTDGKMPGTIISRGKRRGKKTDAKSSGKGSCQVSRFASLDMESDHESEHENNDAILTITNEISQTVRSNTWAAIAMDQLPTNQVEQKWTKVEKPTDAPSSTTVSDFVAIASANMHTNNDAWEDSDDETEPVKYTTPVKKSWADMMDESDEEDD